MLEYNCRFGDPETQAVLPRLRSDVMELLEGSTRLGGLAGVEIEWSPEWAVTVVLASAGYPGVVVEGRRDPRAALDRLAPRGAAARRDGRGGRQDPDRGGRVLNVTGFGATPGEARDRAYAAAERIQFDGKQMRTDIASRAVDRVEA